MSTYYFQSNTIMKAMNAEHDLQTDDRLMDLLKTYHAVHVGNDIEFSEKLTWCLEHCQDKFRDLSEQDGRVWYFQNEQDATMFAMKWA